MRPFFFFFLPHNTFSFLPSFTFSPASWIMAIFSAPVVNYQNSVVDKKKLRVNNVSKPFFFGRLHYVHGGRNNFIFCNSQITFLLQDKKLVKYKGRRKRNVFFETLRNI